MQPLSKEELEGLIEEAKKEGKDTTELEEELNALTEPVMETSTMGEQKQVESESEDEDAYIQSTGPALEEDFE